MNQNQPDILPHLWLLSDARNDAVLEQALAALPPMSGFIYRHYHLDPADRRARFDTLARLARSFGHRVLLSGDPITASEWGADGAYGSAESLTADGAGIRLATAHNEREIAAANAIHADALLLSPVFPTRSHNGAAALGEEQFRALAALADMPVIALGGMNAARAKALGWPRWAAIDGLSENAAS